jgi:LysM repeat protein
VLAVLVAAIAALVLSTALPSKPRATAPKAAPASAPSIPPYWIVRPGDTLGAIALKNGLTVAQLAGYNSQIDPDHLVPGERLNLWRHPPPPPPPRPKPLGPMFWTVQPGQSFGSIAANTGINLATLEQLNPHLKPATLHPGDRVRLRPGAAPHSNRVTPAARGSILDVLVARWRPAS